MRFEQLFALIQRFFASDLIDRFCKDSEDFLRDLLSQLNATLTPKAHVRFRSTRPEV